MADEPTTYDIPVPALLRTARAAYATAVRNNLAASGLEDLPPHGPYVLGGVINQGETLPNLLPGLGLNRERARDLLVTLVQRGYMQRSDSGSDDPEHIPVEPTDRGRAAAAAVQSAIHDVDNQLAARCSAEEIRAMRFGLFALNEIREQARNRMETWPLDPSTVVESSQKTDSR